MSADIDTNVQPGNSTNAATLKSRLQANTAENLKEKQVKKKVFLIYYTFEKMIIIFVVVVVVVVVV
jgi:cell division protein FtsL